MFLASPFSLNRDKFLNRWEKTLFKKYQKSYSKTIIQNHRRQPQSKESKDVPTFEEFVEYLIDTPVWKYNPHWLPYYMTCTPCHQRFDIIMHLDSILVDGNYLVYATGLPELFPTHTHVTIDTSHLHFNNGDQKGKLALTGHQVRLHERIIPTNGTDRTIELSFFSKITKQQLMKLYSVYKIDFDMFSFDISPYDSYVKRI